MWKGSKGGKLSFHAHKSKWIYWFIKRVTIGISETEVFKNNYCIITDKAKLHFKITQRHFFYLPLRRNHKEFLINLTVYQQIISYYCISAILSLPHQNKCTHCPRLEGTRRPPMAGEREWWRLVGSKWEALSHFAALLFFLSASDRLLLPDRAPTARIFISVKSRDTRWPFHGFQFTPWRQESRLGERERERNPTDG